ncbi:hypothetical protein AB4510_21990 [Vibrio sp. 10N.222.54.B12]|uniref:hypothetical protein n=1 Tax=unclassified Vibrio TaxID=2614977 RepID=UPI0035519582
MENPNAQATASNIKSSSSGMTIGSLIVNSMIGTMALSWFALIPHNIYLSLTEKYRTLWITDVLVGKKSISQLMSEFGSEHVLSIVMMLFLFMLNYYVVQQAKMLIDGDEDCMNPHNMDKLSAFLRIFIATSIHVVMWYYMTTTKYAHFFM